jgi:hypothetical protein
MDPVGGLVAAGAAVALVYAIRHDRGRPARKTKTGMAGTPGGSRTRGRTGKVPQRSWLVKAYNSSGAPKVGSEDLSGATAELVGRTAGAAGRRAARRWRIVKRAAARSRDRRERQWQEQGRQPLFVSRRPKPRPEPEQDGPPPDPRPTPRPKPQPDPDTPRTRRLRPVPDPRPIGETMDTTQEAAAATSAGADQIPPDWGLLAERVANFAPEDDAALIAFMRGEVAGVVRYAEAMEQTRDNCVNDVGLDPSAVQGFTTYSEHMSDASARMAEAYKEFMAIYGEVMQLAANGVVMPHRGRFFTGNTV